MVKSDEEMPMIGVVRWVPTALLEQGDGWQSWLYDELRAVINREPANFNFSTEDVVICETSVAEHPHVAKLRTSTPARLFAAEVPGSTEED